MHVELKSAKSYGRRKGQEEGRGETGGGGEGGGGGSRRKGEEKGGGGGSRRKGEEKGEGKRGGGGLLELRKRKHIPHDTYRNRQG
jgi:hypothetical protein